MNLYNTWKNLMLLHGPFCSRFPCATTLEQEPCPYVSSPWATKHTMHGQDISSSHHPQ